MKVLGLSGSLRSDSHNAKLLRAAGSLLPPEAELVHFGGLKAIPPYDPDDDGRERPFAVRALHEAIGAADAVLISTPEYNHSLPGQLKNALDWMSRPYATTPMRGKPVAVIGASTGMFGAVWAQAEARKVLSAFGAQVLDAELPVAAAADVFDADGHLADADLREALGGVLHGLAG